jgi:hypothetical protein
MRLYQLTESPVTGDIIEFEFGDTLVECVYRGYSSNGDLIVETSESNQSIIQELVNIQEDMTDEELDKFHRELDNLIHKYLGHSSEELDEGTWAVPNTMELAKKLQAAMANPIPAKDASDVMYGLIGDDELFDSLYELETDNPSADARPTIARWIQSNRKLLDFNTDDKEVMSVIDDIAGVNEEVEIDEAEYQGKKVTLNKPIRTGKDEPKKFKVYVKDGDKVKMVRFGHQGKGNEKTMKIKKSDPKRRKSFRARHNCDNPGPKTKARYWSCKAW